MFATKREPTPPTILQTFFFSTRSNREVVDPEDHVHLLVVHVHPFHESTNQLSLPLPTRLLKPGLDLGGAVLQTSNDEPALGRQGGRIGEGLVLCF